MFDRAAEESGPWADGATGRARRRAAAGDRRLARLVAGLYRFRRLRPLVLRLVRRIEGGEMHSRTLRRLLSGAHGVEVGPWSYGAVLLPGVLPPGCRVGAYCSVGAGLIVHRRNHPLERPVQHPLFYNATLGLLAEDSIGGARENPLVVGNDVWIGDRVTVLPRCREIGNGAVVAAGAVVTGDVPPYAVVAGAPARVVRQRFDAETAAAIEASRWWTRDPATLLAAGEALLRPADRTSGRALSAAIASGDALAAGPAR